MYMIYVYDASYVYIYIYIYMMLWLTEQRKPELYLHLPMLMSVNILSDLWKAVFEFNAKRMSFVIIWLIRNIKEF